MLRFLSTLLILRLHVYVVAGGACAGRKLCVVLIVIYILGELRLCGREIKLRRTCIQHYKGGRDQQGAQEKKHFLAGQVSYPTERQRLHPAIVGECHRHPKQWASRV